MNAQAPKRIGLVVHPARPIDEALAVLRGWAAARGLDVIQVRAVGSVDRDVAPDGTPERGDVIVALGGDGTVLSALRAAAPIEAPVLGAACGSLGALTAVTAEDIDDAL